MHFIKEIFIIFSINAISVINFECCENCSFEIVESIPEGLRFNSSITNRNTATAWLSLLRSSYKSVDIGALYWSLLGRDVGKGFENFSKQGQQVFEEFIKTGLLKRVKFRIAQSDPSESDFGHDFDSRLFSLLGFAHVRNVSMPKLVGSGILHSKLIVSDARSFYVGSANMDWRALTQVQELGVSVTSCPCLANDARKLFEQYWLVGTDDPSQNASLPAHWPPSLATGINASRPLRLRATVRNARPDGSDARNESFTVFLSHSPPQFESEGRTGDLDAILQTINSAQHYVFVAVMDYVPLFLYQRPTSFWPVLDDALKRAAIERRVTVRLLINWKNHSHAAAADALSYSFSRSSEALAFARSLDALYHFGLNVRTYEIPADASQERIPFARLMHNKFLVTERTAYVGTSNWTPDYFTATAGIGLVIGQSCDGSNGTECVDNSLRVRLCQVFERNWFSDYAHAVNGVSDDRPLDAKRFCPVHVAGGGSSASPSSSDASRGRGRHRERTRAEQPGDSHSFLL